MMGQHDRSEALFRMGTSGSASFLERVESADGLRYCGSPTFRTSSANRGSERMGSSNKLVLNPE